MYHSFALGAAISEKGLQGRGDGRGHGRPDDEIALSDAARRDNLACRAAVTYVNPERFTPRAANRPAFSIGPPWAAQTLKGYPVDKTLTQQSAASGPPRRIKRSPLINR